LSNDFTLGPNGIGHTSSLLSVVGQSAKVGIFKTRASNDLRERRPQRSQVGQSAPKSPKAPSIGSPLCTLFLRKSSNLVLKNKLELA